LHNGRLNKGENQNKPYITQMCSKQWTISNRCHTDTAPVAHVLTQQSTPLI